MRHFSVIFIPCKIVNGGGGWNSLHYLALTQGDLLHSVFLQPLNFYDLWFFSEGFFIYRVLPTSLRSTIYWKNTISASCRDYNKNQIFSWLMFLELWKNFSHEILIKKIENKRAKRAVILSFKNREKNSIKNFYDSYLSGFFLVIFKHCALYPFW